jgi:hypothetical protein
MKKILFLSALVSCVFIMQGCSKSGGTESDDQEPEDTDLSGNCRVIKTTRANFSGSTFEYDDQKRLVKRINGSYTAEISYAGNTITVIGKSGGNLSSTRTVTVNALGYATNVKTEYPNINNSYNEAFEYDGKQLVKITTTRVSNPLPSYTTYQWFEGNMVKETRPNGDITTWAFDTNELSQKGDYKYLVNLLEGYVTIVNKNRVKKVVESGVTYDITHVEDETGKIKYYRVVTSDGADYRVDLTYECD